MEGNVANVAAGMLRMLRMLKYVWILWFKLKGKDLETMTGLNFLGRITVRQNQKETENLNLGTVEPGCWDSMFQVCNQAVLQNQFP